MEDDKRAPTLYVVVFYYSIRIFTFADVSQRSRDGVQLYRTANSCTALPTVVQDCQRVKCKALLAVLGLGIAKNVCCCKEPDQSQLILMLLNRIRTLLLNHLYILSMSFMHE